MPGRNFILDFETEIADLSECYSKAFSKTFREFDIPFDPQKLAEYVSTPMDVLFGRYYHGCTCKYRDFVIMFMGEFDRLFASTAKPFPEITEKIKTAYSQGSRIGVISDIAGMYVEMFLNSLGIRQCISSIVGIDRVFTPKPDPTVLKTCMAELGTCSDDTVVFSGKGIDEKMCSSIGIPVEPSFGL